MNVTKLQLEPNLLATPSNRACRLPGNEGVWGFIAADMLVFALMFGCFMVDRSDNAALFEASRLQLNLSFGGINTLLLLTSSMFVVLTIDALKYSRPRWVPNFLALALACGIAFMVSKIFEYKEKFDSGISMLTNDFFMYYFVLTGIHLAHVAVGSAILAVLWLKSKKPLSDSENLSTYESGATYWHMVDLVWVCIFPLLYLVR